MKCPADGTDCDALWCAKDQCLRQMTTEAEAAARERRAVHPFYLAGYEAGKADAGPYAGLLTGLLRETRDHLERVAEEPGYGFYRPDNPNDFSPDPESSTPEEIANHAAACKAYDAGTYVPDNSDGWITPNIHVTRAPWGIGSYVVRDSVICALVAKIDAALAKGPA